jgi:hypothetical protein
MGEQAQFACHATQANFRLVRAPGPAYTSTRRSIFGNRMTEQIVCQGCDKPEYECKCDRYCWLCQGQDGIRLCADGQYYCPDCREACEMLLANPSGERT